MNFATPLLAGIAAAIAIPTLIILYFLKLRRRDVEISTTLLWKKAIQDLQANAPFQKLRKNLLLFLQLLALAVILFALAQPEFKDVGLSQDRQVILIDRSASMSAVDGGEKGLENVMASASSGKSRLQEAKERAIAMVDQMKEPGLLKEKADEAMVIAFDSSAEVRVGFTSNKAALKAAIDGIESSDGPSSLERAITLAKAYSGTKKFEEQVQEDKGFIATSPPATIHLFSDGRLPDSDRIQTEESDNVVFHAVGTVEAPNVGITGLRAERAFDNPGKVSIFVGLQNTDRQDRTVQVELLLDDAVVKVSDVAIAAATKAIGDADAAASEGPVHEELWNPGIGGTVYTIERAEGAIARVRINAKGPDALATDNLSYLVIPPARRLAVCIVSQGEFVVESALRGMSLSKLDKLKPAEFQRLLDDDQLTQYDVFIFDRWLPDVKVTTVAPVEAGAAGTPAAIGSKRPGLPPGRSLVLGVIPPPPLGAVDEGAAGPTEFTASSWDHPALRMAGLGMVSAAKSRRVKILPDSPVRDIASLTVGPGILEITDSDTLALVVTFDHMESLWVFDPGWVLFLVNSVMYLSEASIGRTAAGGGALRDSVEAGDTLSTRLPAGARDARITLPDNQRLPLEPGVDGEVAYGPVQKTGIYTVSWVGQGTASDVEVDGRVRRPIAANLLSPDESNISMRKNLALAREIVTAQTQKEVLLTRKLWPWLLLGAISLVMFEWWVYNRKVML